MEKNLEITELERQVVYHQKKYYNDEPEISDDEFDALWDRLKELDPKNELFTKKVGEDESSTHQKVEHIIPMGSQQKATKISAFKKWASSYPQDFYILEPKCDGISAELQYENGKFVRAISRGNGKVGDDITVAVKRMKGVPKTLKDKEFSGSVRTEILMLKTIFEKKYPDAKNPRNMASGIAKRKDGTGAEDCFLKSYDALHKNEGDYFENELAKIEWLSHQGFDVVFAKKMSIEEIIEYREEMIKHIREELEYEIDGLVIKLNEIDNEDMKRARPKKQIAFKFPTQNVVSTLIGVDWRISGRNVTPVGLVDPVEIAGTTVKQASLSNPRQIRNMKLMIGSKVMVSKRGEIIPKIESLVYNGSGTKIIDIPTHCESCKSELVNEWTSLYCPNESCDNKLYGRLQTWIKKLGVKNFGDHILGQLYDRGMVRKIQDFYTLKVSDLMELDRVGKRSAEKALGNLFAVKEINLPTFIAGFNIDGVARSTIEMVMEGGFDTLEKIAKANAEQLSGCYGIGGITAELIINGVLSLYNDMIEVAKNVKISQPVEKGDALQGLSFCFTGSLKNFKKRSEAEELVKSLGGTTKSGVSGNLKYLVTNTPDSGSAKNVKAKKLGVKVITEEEFLQLTEGKEDTKKVKNGLDSFF